MSDSTNSGLRGGYTHGERQFWIEVTARLDHYEGDLNERDFIVWLREHVEAETVTLKAECDALRAEVEAAKKDLGGFCEPPFDGTLKTGIWALSHRCGIAERRLEELAQAGAGKGGERL